MPRQQARHQLRVVGRAEGVLGTTHPVRGHTRIAAGLVDGVGEILMSIFRLNRFCQGETGGPPWLSLL